MAASKKILLLDQLISTNTKNGCREFECRSGLILWKSGFDTCHSVVTVMFHHICDERAGNHSAYQIQLELLCFDEIMSVLHAWLAMKLLYSFAD